MKTKKKVFFANWFYLSLEFCPQIQVKPKKKSLLHSGSFAVRNFGFLNAKWVLLVKKQRARHILPPSVSDPRGRCPPAPSKSMPILLRHWLRDESLAPEKLHTILFGTGRLKITTTMKRHAACYVCQDQ